jgi:acyl-CoA thioesterase FadM
MISLLRFLDTLLRPPPGPVLQPGDTTVTRWRVLPGDIDVFGHMNNSRYLVFMDLGRIDFLRRCDLFKGVLRNRWAVPVGGAHMDFRKSLKPFARFELHTRLLYWDERWFYFRQSFHRPGEMARPVCTGHVKTLFLGRQGPVGTARVIEELAGRPLAQPPLTDEVRSIFLLDGPACEPVGPPPTAGALPSTVCA